jgi:hypothetical protein
MKGLRISSSALITIFEGGCDEDSGVRLPWDLIRQANNFFNFRMFWLNNAERTDEG